MTTPSHKIEIANEQSQPFESEILIAAVERIFNDHEISRSELSIAVVDDPTMRRLNRQYLNHDYETDVLSFVLEYDEASSNLVGQLIVSTDTAARESADFGGSMQDELLLYVVHGTLHLVGYDDKQADDEAEMRSAEKKYLESFGVEHRWSTPDSDSDDEREVSS